MNITVAAGTDKGWKRAENEDRYLVRECKGGSFLLAVADGMGGMPEGTLAAAMAVETLADNADAVMGKPEGLLALVSIANEKILRHSCDNPQAKGMGTTLTAMVLCGDTVEWVHIGDSRVYLFHEGVLRRLSADHRFFSRMLERGDITPQEAAGHPCSHMLEQCLGRPDIEPDQGQVKVTAGDSLLLCTDGLYEEVTEKSMAHVLSRDLPAFQKMSLLLEAALEDGGRDNITLIVADIVAC